MNKTGKKIIANNKKARFEYFIEETYEAGIVLSGTEVKSIRLGKVSVKESYCQIENSELFIHGMHISPYEHGNIYNLDPVRKRKLLMKRKEINRLAMSVKEKGYTLVPLSVYITEGLVKIEIALAKGKKLYDKRESLAEKDSQRKIERGMMEKY